jgi:MFS family permease
MGAGHDDARRPAGDPGYHEACRSRFISHPSGARSNRSKGAALAVLATAQLGIALDYAIVNVTLPDIGRSLHFSGGTVQWVISACALTFGGFLLLGGRAADDLLDLFRRAIEDQILPYAASLSELAVAWTLANPAVQVAIVGTRRLAQLDGTASAADLHLSAADLRRIDAIVAAAAPGWGPHPQGM